MPLTAESLQSRFQAIVAPGDDTEFFRLLTEADERLLSSGRWHWARTPVELTPDENRIIELDPEFKSIVGCRIGSVPRNVVWQETEYLDDGPGEILVENGSGRLIDQGLWDDSDDSAEPVRRYKLADTTTDLVTALCRYAPVLVEAGSDTLICPSAIALKQECMAIVYEESNNTQKAMEYHAMAVNTLKEMESAYRGNAREIFKPNLTMRLSRKKRTNIR